MHFSGRSAVKSHEIEQGQAASNRFAICGIFHFVDPLANKPAVGKFPILGRNQAISITQLYHTLRASFWFVPATLVLLALVAAFFSIRIDQSSLGRAILDILPGDDQLTVDGARQMVATVAGSTITVASLVFSLTFVALTLMSQQFGPRIVLVFMNDRLTKFVIGAFAGTFLYALVILGGVGFGHGETVTSTLDGAMRFQAGTDLFIPKLSVYMVVMLGIFSFVLIIFFVHHMAISIQADAIIARLSNELDHALTATLQDNGTVSDNDKISTISDKDRRLLEKSGEDVLTENSGYIQFIEFDHLLEVASQNDAKIQLTCRPGHFVVTGRPIARAVSGPKCDVDLHEIIRGAVEIGERRTQAQSAEYEVSALVEVALRALSPGINDPFTAIACIDHLTDSFAILLREAARHGVLYDDDGTARIFRPSHDFKHFLDTAFHPLRESARSNTQVMIKMVQSLDVLSALSKTKIDQSALRAHSQVIKQDCLREIKNEDDKKHLAGLLKRLETTLDSA